MIKVIGERLAEVRKDNKDTQKDLADKLNVTKYTVSHWEQGKNEPSHDQLVKICQLYDVSSDYLLGISNIDPAYAQRQRQRFTQEELEELKRVERYLLWRRKNEPDGNRG